MLDTIAALDSIHDAGGLPIAWGCGSKEFCSEPIKCVLLILGFLQKKKIMLKRWIGMN